MTGRRPPSYTAKLEAMLADYAADNARLRQRDAEQCKRIAELEHPPAPKVLLKIAARNAGITRTEKLRRWCEAGKVVGEQLGKKRNGPWLVDEQSLAIYLRQTTLKNA